MTRFKAVCGAALLLALLLVGVAITSSTAAATPVPPKYPPQGHGPNTKIIPASQIFIDGGPAIQVHTTTGATAKNASTPAFTRNDVITYLNKSGFPAGPLVPGAHLKFLTIQFVTAKQASNLMKGEFVGRPDDYLVCYVKVQGPFTLEGIRVAQGFNRATADTGDMVFDAHTGNLIVWGFY